MGDTGEGLAGRFRDVLWTARAAEPSLPSAPSLPDPGEIAQVVDDLLAKHDVPGRHHHTSRHLAEVLAEVDRLVAIDQRWWQVPSAVDLAVLFHDVVYDPTRDDNEGRSAEVADTTLADLGVATPLRDEVTRLVRLTATHDPGEDDPAGQLLTDGDLWILASTPDRYDQYVRDVRAEYRHLSDHEWETGRGRVLVRLAERIDQDGYRVGPAPDRSRRTVAALDNIDRELDTLAA